MGIFDSVTGLFTGEKEPVNQESEVKKIDLPGYLGEKNKSKKQTVSLLTGAKLDEAKKPFSLGVPENFISDPTGELDPNGDNITSGRLFETEKKIGGVMNKFVKKNVEVLEGKEKVSYSVNFGKNENAEHNIGLADILPEDVKKVRITGVRNGRKYDMEGVRQGLKGGFYTTEGKYIPIFSGFNIEVVESFTKEELTVKKQENEKKVQEVLSSPLVEKFKSKYTQEQMESIVRKAQEYGIDPTFVMTLRSTENGREGLDFGVMKAGIDTFEGQLNISCRVIQHNVNRYKKMTGQDAIGPDGRFIPEFIGYFSNKYTPIGASNDPLNRNKNHLTNLIIFYSAYSGKDFGNIETIVAQNSDFIKKWDTGMNSGELTGTTSPENFIANAGKHLGKEYVRGGGRGDTSVTDCSGLVLMSMKETGVADFGYNNTAEGLSKITKQKSHSETKRGDLVFLQNDSGHITHVEIALGPVENGQIPIIDASKSKGEVSCRYQKVSDKVLVGTPIFYNV